MRAARDDAPAAEHEDEVGVGDGGDALGDEHLRGVRIAFAQGRAQRRVGAVVERAGGIVEHEDVRMPAERAGDHHALLLPAGEVVAAHVQLGLKALLVADDEAVRLRVARCLHDLLVGERAPEADVLGDGVLKERVGLERDAEVRAQRGVVHRAHILPEQAHRARIRVVKAHQQADERRFAGARLAEDAQRLPAAQREVDVGERFLAGAAVAEGDVLKGDGGRALVLLCGGGGQRGGHVLGHVDDRHHPVGGGSRAGEHDEHLGDVDHGVQDDREIGHEREDAADLARAGSHTRRARDDDGDLCAVEEHAGGRTDARHHAAGLLFIPDDLAGDFVKARALHVRLGERLDHANARRVLAHEAHELVAGVLHKVVERDADLRDVHGDPCDERQRRHEDEREHGVERQRDEDAADGQNRRAHAEPLHAAEHVVDVVGVGRQPGDERGLGDLVRLRGGEAYDAFKEVMTDGARGIAGDGAGHAVGGDVHRERADGAHDHQQAVEVDQALVSGGDDAVDDVRQNPRQEQIHDRAEELDAEPQRHACVVGAQIDRQYLLHVSLHGVRKCRLFSKIHYTINPAGW